jgi:hypothetical protein
MTAPTGERRPRVGHDERVRPLELPEWVCGPALATTRIFVAENQKSLYDRFMSPQMMRKQIDAVADGTRLLTERGPA